MVVAVAQCCECARGHRMVQFNTVKTVDFVLRASYHNRKRNPAPRPLSRPRIGPVGPCSHPSSHARRFRSSRPLAVVTSAWPASLETSGSPRRRARLALSRPSEGRGARGHRPTVPCVSSRREGELSSCLWIHEPLKRLSHRGPEGMGRFPEAFQPPVSAFPPHPPFLSRCLLVPVPLFRGKAFSHRKIK